MSDVRPSDPARGKKPLVVVVTGLSGAGRTTALRALEDLGFFCIDNLPTVLAPEAVSVCENGGIMRVALGIDVRVRAFLGEVGAVLSTIERPRAEADGERELQVLFLDASDETLLHRFSETRRPHALAANDGSDAREGKRGAVAVLDGVHMERERLSPLRARATRIIDTTSLSVHELRRLIIAHFGPASGAADRMAVRVVSFGFKYGTPVDADLVLDVRFLKNPYFVPELKSLAGTDPRVADFVMSQPETAEFLAKTRDLLAFVMPKYEREGKSYLTIGIGCTGGRHRSVVIAETLARELGENVGIIHRDVERGDPNARHAGHAPPRAPHSAASEFTAGLSPLPQPVSEPHLKLPRGPRG